MEAEENTTLGCSIKLDVLIGGEKSVNFSKRY